MGAAAGVVTAAEIGELDAPGRREQHVAGVWEEVSGVSPPSDRGLNARCEGEAEKLLPRFTWVVAGSPAAPTVDLQPVTQVAAPSVLPNRYPKAEGAFCVRGITAAPLSLRYGRIPVGLYGHPASCLLRLRPLCTPSQAQPPLPALAEGAFSGFRGSSAYKLPCAVLAARNKASVSFRSA